MQNNGFYTTKDVLKRIGVTRPTLYNWLKLGKISEVNRDRNNFRLFTKRDIDSILAYKNLIRKPTINNSNMKNRDGAESDGKHA